MDVAWIFHQQLYHFLSFFGLFLPPHNPGSTLVKREDRLYFEWFCTRNQGFVSVISCSLNCNTKIQLMKLNHFSSEQVYKNKIKWCKFLTMDKLSGISFTLFFIADCFAVAALCMPDWIVSNVGGKIFDIFLRGNVKFSVMYYFFYKKYNITLQPF